MSYFRRQLDDYARRFGLTASDRRRVAARWPLFKLFYWARSGSPRVRAIAMPAFRLFAGHRVPHTLRAPDGRTLRFELSFDEFDFATFREVLWGSEYDSPVDLSGARTYVDLGANTGIAAVRFRLAAPLERLVLVEANPAQIRRLRARVPGAEVVHAAVVAAPAGPTTTLFLSDNPRHASTNPVGGRTVEVPARSLTAILDHAGLDSVDICKIDIEGSEHDLLAHEPHAISRARTLFVEVHGDGTRRDSFVERLTALGFQIVRRHAEPGALSESVVATRQARAAS